MKTNDTPHTNSQMRKALTRALSLSFIIWHLAFSTSCANDDDLKGYTPDAQPIRIVQNDLLFTSEGGSQTVLIDADGIIEAATDAPWCQATVSGHAVSVSVEANTAFSGRTALLTVSTSTPSGTRATRQLPLQQQGMVLDLPMVSAGHHSPRSGDEFSVTIHHSLPLDAASPQPWIHPYVSGSTLRVSVDDNHDGHLRRGIVACACGEYRDTLHISQYDITDDVVGSYYMMGYYGGTGGAATATRFDVIQRADSLFMHWPQERYDRDVPLTLDRPSCTLFIPSGFTLYEDARSSVNGYFYDTDGYLATASGAGINARLYYSESAGLNAAMPVMANWPGHELGGFILRNTSIVSTTLLQLGSPVLMRVGPPGTSLSE